MISCACVFEGTPRGWLWACLCDPGVLVDTWVLGPGAAGGPAARPRARCCAPPQDVVNTHPGLAFLKEAAEFHSRYITTVSAAPAAPTPRSHQAHVSVGLFSGAREG